MIFLVKLFFLIIGLAASASCLVFGAFTLLSLVMVYQCLTESGLSPAYKAVIGFLLFICLSWGSLLTWVSFTYGQKWLLWVF